MSYKRSIEFSKHAILAEEKKASGGIIIEKNYSLCSPNLRYVKLFSCSQNESCIIGY